MLNLELCHIDHSVSAAVANASTIIDEGMALVVSGALTGGDGINVKPCSSTANERFYGVSMFERRSPTTMPYVFEFTMPTIGTGAGEVAEGTTITTLPHTPTANTIRMFDDNTAMYLADVHTSGTTATGLILSGKEIKSEETIGEDRWIRIPLSGNIGDTGLANSKLGAIASGSTVRVQYSYAPSLAQQRALVGTILDSPLSAGARVTCIRKGTIFTSFYDTAQIYSVGARIGLGGGW